MLEKTAIGKRLALRLDLPFTDVDQERDGSRLFGSRFFERYVGEAEFRQGERRVLSRLLGKGPGVLATGGAFMDKRTRYGTSRKGNFNLAQSRY